jgi:hypothetical protein
MAARQIALGVLLLVLSLSPAFAQEFKEWTSKEDLFAANFPGEPVVTTITWETEYGAKIPGRVYTVTLPGPRTYSMTVINYNPVQGLLTAKAKACPDQADERCTGHTSWSGPGYWKNDVRGAMIYVAKKFMKSDITLGEYTWNYLGAGIEVNELQFVRNKDKSRSFVNIYMHHNILYFMEENVPGDFPPPGIFVQSINLRHAEGTAAPHNGVYFNGPMVEPNEINVGIGGRGGRGGQGPGGAQAPEGGQGRPGGPGAPRNNP